MDKAEHGDWVYILARRYRGELYIGITADLVARMMQHRAGEGSQYATDRGIVRLVWAEFIEPIDLAIAHEKRVKRWRRAWKFALIEKGNPDWRDLFDELAGS